MPLATDEITWKEPRSVAIVIAWGIMNASIVLLAFLNGRQGLVWYDLLLLFFVSAFAGVILAEVKTVVLGIFETLFLSVVLTFFFMVLPAIVGNVAGFYHANVIYTMSVNWVFWLFFPTGMLAIFLGGLFGTFVEDLVF